MRRRRLSEILRMDRFLIGDPSTTEYWSFGRSEQGASTHARYPHKRPVLPDIRYPKIPCSTLTHSLVSAELPEDAFARISPLVKFRMVVHKVMTHQFWTKKFKGVEQHLKTTYLGPGEKPGEKELLTFNAKSFRSDVQYKSLSLRAKTILTQPTWLRTDEDLQYIYRYTIRLHCFSRYSAFVRKELAKVLYYEKIDRDHYVIRQGHKGWFFYSYFIVSGSCLVEMEDVHMCLRSGKVVSMIAGEVKCGGNFGDLALMHGSVRRASVITHEDCEFLKVDKPNFDEVLRRSHKSEWKKRLVHLSNHPLFQQWKDANLNTAVEGSQAKEYVAGSVILKDLSVPLENVYFIIHGCCQVVKRVKLWEKVQISSDNIHLNTVYYGSPRPNRFGKLNVVKKNCKLVGNRVYRLVTKWWVMRTLNEGEYFGLGEGVEGMSIVCNQKVVILCMSKTVFRKHDRARDMAYLRSEAMSWYPSNEEALASYKEWKRWLQYRRNIVLEVLGCRKGKESTENYMLAD